MLNAITYGQDCTRVQQKTAGRPRERTSGPCVRGTCTFARCSKMLFLSSLRKGISVMLMLWFGAKSPLFIFFLEQKESVGGTGGQLKLGGERHASMDNI